MNGALIPAPTTSQRIIAIVVYGIAINTVIGVSTLAACMVLGLKPETGLVTAFVGVTGQLVGSLTGLLVNTRTQTPSAETPPTALSGVSALPTQPTLKP